MKLHVCIILSSIFLSIGCRNGPGDSMKADSIPEAPKTQTSPHFGNMVRDEAPDALVKSEQGYAMATLDSMEAQSPINILTTDLTKEGTAEVIATSSAQITAIENLGHTIQLDFSDSSLTIANGVQYAFKQLHFHTPSEHLIDGVTFPLEMHMVNQVKQSKPGEKTKYLVVSILFKMGHENKFLKEFMSVIPAEENKKVSLEKGTVRLNDLFTGLAKHEANPYYHYQGSLTTPPFTETVDWFINKHVFEASADQILTLERMEGNNARHVQDRHDRKIYGE